MKQVKIVHYTFEFSKINSSAYKGYRRFLFCNCPTRGFRARAGIEPIIGHVKHDHRMERNFLAGVIGDQTNTILAATGFNLMKKLRKIKEGLFVFIFKLIIWIENQIRFKRKILLIHKPEVFQV